MGDNIRISALTHCDTLSGDEYIPLTQMDNADATLRTKYGTPDDIGAYVMNFVFPAGVVVPYGGSEAPTGWLLCDGNPVSKTTYARLYAAIGNKFGETSTTFNTPNLGGRIPLGVCNVANLSSVVGEEGPGPAKSLYVGASGGEFRHTLSASSLPSHAHGVVTYLNAVNSGNSGAGTGFPIVNSGNITGNVSYKYTDNRIWEGTTGSTSYNRSGDQIAANGAHNNIQPYIAMNYIIKC